MELSPQLRFKLQRLRSALGSMFGAKSQSFDSAHRMCSNCRALIERDASVCPFCGAPTRPARARAGLAPGRVLGGLIPVPSTATSVLVAVNIAIYAISWYMTQLAMSGGTASSTITGDIPREVLVRLGAKFGPLILAGQWWRLVTAMFLHVGLLHIGMNLWCLIDLGAEVESLFSTTKFIAIYLATGICGFLLSLWWSPGVPSAGASGAVFGLIGVLIGASFHHGRLGQAYRSGLWRWVLYMFLFGIFFAVDNAAHLGGLVTGIALGYVMPEGEPATRAGENFWNALAILSVVIIAGSFALMAVQLNLRLR